MKSIISLIFILILTPVALGAVANPPEQFICQGIAANFPGTCLLQGTSLLTADWIDCFSWYQYGPEGDLSGPNHACEQTVERLNLAIEQKGLCLCEQQGDFGAQLRKWVAGSFSYEVVEQFPRVEPADTIPASLWGKAYGLCSAALKKAETEGVCPQ